MDLVRESRECPQKARRGANVVEFAKYNNNGEKKLHKKEENDNIYSDEWSVQYSACAQKRIKE